MKILITGAAGMLASDLLPILSSEHDVVGLTRQQLDITDTTSLRDTLKSLSPEVVVNCAAYTKVDLAETERQKAFMVNGIGVYNLSVVCSELDIILCHISTDYVFDGQSQRAYTPFDPTRAVNFYGLTKLAGEKYIQWNMKRFYIVRTSWLYGVKGNNFVKTILRLAKERNQLRVVSDQRGSPTWTVTLARGIKRIIESGHYGIHHVTDKTEGGISWYEFAREILKYASVDCEVIPIKTEEYPTPAQRPSYSVLDTFFTEVSTGFVPPDWRESLKNMLQALNQSSPSA